MKEQLQEQYKMWSQLELWKTLKFKDQGQGMGWSSEEFENEHWKISLSRRAKEGKLK